MASDSLEVGLSPQHAMSWHRPPRHDAMGAHKAGDQDSGQDLTMLFHGHLDVHIGGLPMAIRGTLEI